MFVLRRIQILPAMRKIAPDLLNHLPNEKTKTSTADGR